MSKLSLQDFDFSGKRVRYQGKALSKFELSFYIGSIQPLDAYSIYPDAFLYIDYVNRLKSLLS